MLLWLLLSGHFNILFISFGIVSVLFVLLMARRMELIDHESHPITMAAQLLWFWLVLAKKIFTANIDVTLRILGVKPINPQLIKIPLEQSSDLTKAIYANAITLTPGSASLHIEDGYLYVHTISEEGAQALLEGEIAKLIPLDKNNQAGENQ
ncbi:Na+/H+ antiporter subunit E [Aliiglaciecola sp. LCG003]|uniref:Na+/H+ antiporter subunit E n=1 Tax=Aliiglaciecola sp. LCG003 TaxID=3053655 RepID=UPI0025725909|nr:Na+/H+ antiporter subunit E [Aliiglaciecola sp. LCG003]WJG08212.1 Na+/H+ antiporter subunit E [Aliiglaciecola sp. LCG003]